MTNYIRIEKKIRKDSIWKRGGGGTGCEEPRREEDLVGLVSLGRRRREDGLAERRRRRGSVTGPCCPRRPSSPARETLQAAAPRQSMRQAAN